MVPGTTQVTSQSFINSIGYCGQMKLENDATGEKERIAEKEIVIYKYLESKSGQGKNEHRFSSVVCLLSANIRVPSSASTNYSL
jgi:hypothetical protein